MKKTELSIGDEVTIKARIKHINNTSYGDNMPNISVRIGHGGDECALWVAPDEIERIIKAAPKPIKVGSYVEWGMFTGKVAHIEDGDAMIVKLYKNSTKTGTGQTMTGAMVVPVSELTNLDNLS